MHKPAIAALGLAALLAGCAGLNPDYTRPAVDLPQAWRDAPAEGVRAQDAPWWKVYGDPVLDRLIEEALANNASVMLALARVDEARAALGATSAEQLPYVTASANRNRTRLSQRGATPLPPGFDPEHNDTRVSADVSYEIDLWGRLRNATQAARAELLATEAARETVRIALTSDVAQGYFALRALDAQLAATRRSLATRTEALELQKKRAQLGDISEYDYRQLEADVAAERAQVPVLEQQRAQQENALAVLLGRSPRAIYEGALEAGTDPEEQTVAIVVPSGLPSDLLLRRPDLVQAEQTLIAANARVAVARAAYFPRISLTGSLGSESVALSDLFTGPAGERLPRRAQRARRAGQGARAARGRGRSRGGAEDDAAVCAPALRERHDQPARSPRRREEPARRRAEPHRRAARAARGDRGSVQGAGRGVVVDEIREAFNVMTGSKAFTDRIMDVATSA